MKVLLIAPYFPPDSNQSALMYSNLADDLVVRGCTVVVVTTRCHYSGRTEWKTWWPYVVEAKGQQCKVLRVYVPHSDRQSFVKRMIVAGFYNILSAAFLLFSKPADVAVLPNPAYLGALIAFVAVFEGARLHYRIHDLYPDVAVRLGLIRDGGVISAILRMLETLACRYATNVSVVTDAFERRMLEAGVGKDKLTVVPDWVDTDCICPGPRRNSFSDRYALTGKTVIMYGGNVGLSQGLETLLRAAGILKARDGLLFLIIGEGASKARLMALKEQLNLDNVLFLPCQSAETLSEVYAACDMGFVSLRKQVAPEWCPAKVYTIMASGRPVLASVDLNKSQTSEVVQRWQCGICVPPEDASALAKAILHLAQSSAARAQLGSNGRAAAQAQYSRKVCTERLYRIIVAAAGCGSAQ
jgi:colanic acid biosynthesis glycosyl transferase WcaI